MSTLKEKFNKCCNWVGSKQDACSSHLARICTCGNYRLVFNAPVTLWFLGTCFVVWALKVSTQSKDLDNFFRSPARFEVNPLTGPIPVETEDFVGRLLLLQRPDPEPEEWTYKELFRGKLRNVQFRLQGRFKTEPGKEMFMSIQAPREVLLDSIRKKAASLSLNFINKMVQRTGGELNYNVDWKKFPDSDILQPHLTMPLCSLDVLIQTPHGEEPPSLTTPMERVPQAVKKAVSFNSTDTYTIMWWSKYVDLFRWRRINFPLGVNGTLEPYLGREVHVCIFRLPLEDELKAMEADGLPPPNDPLCESQKLTYLRLKVSHSALTEEEFEECVDWDEVEEDLDWDASAREKGA